jgi:hypothetical protein
MGEPDQADGQPAANEDGRDSASDRDRRRRRRRRDATIVTAWIGAGAVVAAAVVAIIPSLLPGDASNRTGPMPEGTATATLLLPTPTCDSCKSGKTYPEEAGNGGARTFRDPRAMLGEGDRVRSFQKIDVLCKLESPIPGSPSVGRYWYLVVSAPWGGRYFTIANSYLNGDSPDPSQGTHETAVDVRVPDC